MEFFNITRLVSSLRRSALIKLTVGLVVALSFTQLSSLEAKKKPKVDICHYNEDKGTFKLLNISGNAVDAHLNNHGDSLASDPANGLDVDCTPMDALVFARAFRNIDGIDGYDPEFDLLYAEIVDANGDWVLDAGDKVLVNVFPSDFTLNPMEVITVGVASHTISDIFSVIDFEDEKSIFVLIEHPLGDTLQIIFSNRDDREEYFERHIGEAEGLTRLRDLFAGTNDQINIEVMSPSRPSEAIPSATKDTDGNDPWLDVEIDFSGL